MSPVSAFEMGSGLRHGPTERRANAMEQFRARQMAKRLGKARYEGFGRRGAWIARRPRAPPRSRARDLRRGDRADRVPATRRRRPRDPKPSVAPREDLMTDSLRFVRNGALAISHTSGLCSCCRQDRIGDKVLKRQLQPRRAAWAAAGEHGRRKRAAGYECRLIVGQCDGSLVRIFIRHRTHSLQT